MSVHCCLSSWFLGYCPVLVWVLVNLAGGPVTTG
jgi:hypothetical protein